MVFEAFMGKRYACSPKALYEAMMEDPAYRDWKKIWAFRNPEKYHFLKEKKNTQVVAYRKKAYYRAYGGSGILDHQFPAARELKPKKDQEYIQCWHGTPLKKAGI